MASWVSHNPVLPSVVEELDVLQLEAEQSTPLAAIEGRSQNLSGSVIGLRTPSTQESGVTVWLHHIDLLQRASFPF